MRTTCVRKSHVKTSHQRMTVDWRPLGNEFLMNRFVVPVWCLCVCICSMWASSWKATVKKKKQLVILFMTSGTTIKNFLAVDSSYCCSSISPIVTCYPHFQLIGSTHTSHNFQSICHNNDAIYVTSAWFFFSFKNSFISLS